MKKVTFYFVILALSITNPFYAQTYKYLGDYTSNGTPLYLESERDNISIATLEMINNSIPENYPVPDYNPQYITAGYDTDLKITVDTDVYITFVDEGAGYRNVLGFYTYDLENPLTSKPAREDITIIFPNASLEGKGGGLKVGDKVNIGNFKAGTGIGWVLLANAWSSSQQKVGWGLWDLYSNSDFNPEADEDKRQHVVSLVDNEAERIIIGFEDIRRDRGGCDHDFNDAIFYVSVDSFESINVDNFADVSDASNVTSAYDGGLESNGDLASLIAKRNFKRLKNNDLKRLQKNQLKFEKSILKSKSNANNLINYLPETGMYGTEKANISSPDDLLQVTNAKKVFSVDYYEGNTRVSAVLATETEGKVYDHSKMICDRLNKSSLEDVRTVRTRGHQIITSKIKRSSGETEYTLSFSVNEKGNQFELFSFWNIDQYPEGNYKNYQIWGSSFSQVFAIANFIIDTYDEQGNLVSTKIDDVLPLVFVKSGHYLNGQLKLEIVNKSNKPELFFSANIAETETSNYTEMFKNINLSGSYNEEITINTGVLFDLGLSIGTDSSVQKDALYLADGPWGIDYLDTFAEVNEFDITYEARDYLEDQFEVDRNVLSNGEVKGNVNLFRHILPGDQTLDLEDYEYLNFELSSNKEVELIIIQDEDRLWENRLRMILPISETLQKISVSLNEFKNGEGKSEEITNVKTIVFSVIGDYKNFDSYALNVKNVSFSAKNNALSTIDLSPLKSNKVFNYPNPFNDITTLVLPVDSNSCSIQVFDLLGRIVDVKNLSSTKNKRITYKAPKLKNGIYKYLITDENKKKFKGSFLIN